MEASYVKYATQAAKYNQEQADAREAKAKAEALAALAEVWAQASSSSAPTPAQEEQNPVVSSAGSYGANPWGSDDGAEDDACEPPPPSVTIEEGYRSEFKKVWKAWSSLPVKWEEHFPSLEPVKDGKYDLVEHLMPLDVGGLYIGISPYFQKYKQK